MFSDPNFYCVVAEIDGRIVGSNCLDERVIIRGVGPITIDPGVQNMGVGRLLMRAVMDRVRDRGAAAARLVQAAFHNRSLSLYTSFGFDVREPLSCLQGQTRERSVPGCEVRPAIPADEDACNELSRRVHGFDRGVELAEVISDGTARVVERGGRVTGYATHLAFFGHSTAETNLDIQALLASVESFVGPGVLVPSRDSVLLRWLSAEWSPGCTTDDADERRAVQRSRGRLVAIRHVLVTGPARPGNRVRVKPAFAQCNSIRPATAVAWMVADPSLRPGVLAVTAIGPLCFVVRTTTSARP